MKKRIDVLNWRTNVLFWYCVLLTITVFLPIGYLFFLIHQEPVTRPVAFDTRLDGFSPACIENKTVVVDVNKDRRSHMMADRKNYCGIDCSANPDLERNCAFIYGQSVCVDGGWIIVVDNNTKTVFFNMTSAKVCFDSCMQEREELSNKRFPPLLENRTTCLREALVREVSS